MAPSKQRAVRITETDEDLNKTLKLEEVDVPTLQDGEVLVRITLRPVNPTDVYQSRGNYGHQTPFIPGSEATGVVEELGPGTSGRLAKGQRVVATTWGLQSWQEYAAVKEEDLVAVPDDINDEIASQLFITTLTVIGLVETANVPKGGWLLQTAAASGLGRQVIQYAKHVGIQTINVVRRADQVQDLRELGGDVVIDSSSEDIAEKVKEVTGGDGADAALDAVAGRTTNDVVKSLKQGGKVVVYGMLASPSITVDVSALFGRSIETFIIYGWLPSHGPEGARQRLEAGFKLFQDGVLTAHPGKQYPFDQVKEAVEASLQPGRSAASPKIFLESK